MQFVPGGTGFLVFDIESAIYLVVFVVLLALKIYALVVSLTYSAESYVAADRLNKPTWCTLLAIAVVLQVVPIPLAFVNLAGTVLVAVFLADVKPALASLRRR